jgi:hypothetical protein
MAEGAEALTRDAHLISRTACKQTQTTEGASQSRCPAELTLKVDDGNHLVLINRC